MKTASLLGAAVLFLAAAPPAAAKVYCVAPTGGCADGNFSTFQAALDQAESNAGPDQVRLGMATYTTSTGFTYGGDATNSVEISGQGSIASFGTTLTRSTNGAILGMSGTARNTVRDLKFYIAGTTSSFGLQGGSADVLRVDLDSTPGLTNSEGLQMLPGSARRVNVRLPVGGSNIAIVTGGSSAATDGVFESRVEADTGLYVSGGEVLRSDATGGQAAIRMSSGTIDDSFAHISGTGPQRVGLLARNVAGGSGSVNARHLTILGDGGPGSVGIEVIGDALIVSSTETADVRNTIVRGAVKSFQRFGTSFAGNIGTANLSVHYTDYDPSTGEQSGAGTGPNLVDPTNPNVDPKFVNPAGRDLRLSWSSPLIDAGDPAALALDEPNLDAGSNPRVVDGDGNGTARRDIGATEYQRRAPVFQNATATPLGAPVGKPFTFMAEGFDPDGDPLAYSWSFDDGKSVVGATAHHAFATIGIHTAKVTVSDPTAQTDSRQIAVGVTPGPRALLLALSLSPTRFRAAKGTTVSFMLSQPSKVKFTVDHTVGGRRVKGKCRRLTRSNRSRPKCTRHVGVKGSFARAGATGVSGFHFNARLKGKLLRPGSYRLIGKVGSGKSASVRRAKFVVKRP
jgi:PKD domain-containing protein